MSFWFGTTFDPHKENFSSRHAHINSPDNCGAYYCTPAFFNMIRKSLQIRVTRGREDPGPVCMFQNNSPRINLDPFPECKSTINLLLWENTENLFSFQNITPDHGAPHPEYQPTIMKANTTWKYCRVRSIHQGTLFPAPISTKKVRDGGGCACLQWLAHPS